jgi:hypothetical protein
MKSTIIKLENLFLDPNNYRLRSNPDWVSVDLKNFLKPAIQTRTQLFIAGENNIKIIDLLESIKANGFLKVDSILVRKYEKTDNYYVIEGNRRIAALKELQKQKEKGYDVGKLQDTILEKGLDVVEYEYSDEKDYLILMGLKHVSGNKKWDFYNQAKLLYELKMSGEDESQIAKKIGLGNKSVVEQQIRGYLAIQDFLAEIKDENYGDKFDPYQKLQMFIELTTRPKLKKWTGWDETTFSFQNKENLKRFFSWILPKIEILEDSADPEIESPIIVNHKQVRELENIVDEEETLQYLEETRNFEEALNQNFAYTQVKFSKVIKSVEKILRNIPIGTTLSISEDDTSSLKVSKQIIEEILSKGNSK